MHFIISINIGIIPWHPPYPSFIGFVLGEITKHYVIVSYFYIIILLTKIPKICLCICLTLLQVGHDHLDLSSPHLGFKTLIAKSTTKEWSTRSLSIIYESQWSLHVILIKYSSRVWSWFALETLVCVDILSNFFNKLPHQLIKFLMGHFKIHHLMHIWSTMNQESPKNWRLASYLMVVGQMNSSDQN
jgi:hypothetical protein